MARLPQGIVITTSEATKDWLPECLSSLGDAYPILVVGNMYRPETPHETVVNDWNGFELGGILRGQERFWEFIHLMDTCVVERRELLDIMFAQLGSSYLCDGFFSYLGKYQSDILEVVGVPKINSKEEAIRLERDWNAKYLKVDEYAKQFNPPLPVHTEVFEERHGRKNMVLSNGYITKYKATWSL